MTHDAQQPQQREYPFNEQDAKVIEDNRFNPDIILKVISGIRTRPHTPAPEQCPSWKNNQCNFDGTDCPSIGCQKAHNAMLEENKRVLDILDKYASGSWFDENPREQRWFREKIASLRRTAQEQQP